MKLLPPVRFVQVAAFLTPPVSILAPRSLAVLLPLAALAAGVSALERRTLRMPPAGPTVVMAAALLWGAASTLWAYESKLVWSVWFQIAGLAVAGLILVQVALQADEEDGARIGSALAIGVIVSVAFLAVEWTSAHLFGHSLTAMFYTRRKFETFVFNRAAATIAIFVWPAALGARWRWGGTAASVLIIVTFVVIAQFESMAAVVGMIAGMIVYLAASWRARPVALVLAGLVVIGAIAAPVLPRLSLVDTLIERSNGSVSISHRLQIWRFAAEAVAEHPVAGWGLNASRDLPGGIDEIVPRERKLPLHPHNAMLQWWLELGAVGAALGTALVVLALLGAGRLGPALFRADPVRAAALAATASASVVALVGYGIWQAWWMAALWLAAAATAALGGSRRA
jgi:exopolysaccharide production protein ExoQ